MKQVISVVIIILLISVAFCWGYTSYFDAKGSSPSATIFINEVMPSNNNVISDDDGDFSDWIELYNAGSSSTNIGGWFLSDEKGNLKWKFPESTYIRGRGYMLVWASGKDKGESGGSLHTSFKISSSGDKVFLYNSDGIEISSIKTPSLDSNTSFGRSMDGANTAAIFETTTPGNSNAAGILYKQGLESPIFSHTGGFYSNGFLLSLASNDSKNVIRYTLDGSEPDESSPIYTKPIEIADRSAEPNLYTDIVTSLPRRQMEIEQTKKATVVRARVFRDGYEPGNIATNTYFVDNDMKNRYNLPIIALTTNSDNLFDREKGIYVPGATFDDWQLNNHNMVPGSKSPANYYQRGETWERPIHIEYYDLAGNQRLAQDTGVRIHGGRTSSKPQKSLRLYARSDYDSQNVFAFDIFQDLKAAGKAKTKSKYKRLVLSNSGDDWEHAAMRNSLIQSLVEHTDIDTIEGMPTIVFINGEFWGIHYIQERLDRFYLESHYGVNPNKIVLLDNNGELNEGNAGDEADYFRMLDFILSHDISVEDNYNHLNTLMDIDNYIDYFVINTYCNNVDWPHNNVKLWRYKGEDVGESETSIDYSIEEGTIEKLDGRWHWVLYDTDLGFGLGEDSSFNMLEWALRRQSPATGEQWPGTIIIGLMENEVFRHELINRYADYMNTSFKVDVVIDSIDDLSDKLMTSMEEHLSRWDLLGGSVDRWQQNVDELRTFAKQRPAHMRQHLQELFELDGTVSITIDNTNTGGGFIRLNSIDINADTPGVEDSSSFTGEYFKSVPIVLTPQPMPGYEFNGWTGIDDNQDIERIGDSLRIIPKGDITVSASFKQSHMRTLASAFVIALMIVVAIIIVYALLRLLPFRKWRIIRGSL